MHNIFLVWRDTTEKLYKPQNVNRQIPKKYGVEAIADYSFIEEAEMQQQQ